MLIIDIYQRVVGANNKSESGRKMAKGKRIQSFFFIMNGFCGKGLKIKKWRQNVLSMFIKE